MTGYSVQRALIRQFFASLKWTRHSYYLLSGFLLTVFLIIYVWWPLAEEYLAYVDWNGAWWLYMDWLLIGIFLFMSMLIMAGANLRSDALIVFVGAIGGLVIEGWGTQTNLWFYYTAERPPLWIIPAWPIASLAIDRLIRLGSIFTERIPLKVFKIAYWLVFTGFLGLMLVFVAPTFDKSSTWLALALCIFFILTPTDHCWATLTFVAGSGLGYFLELWGTTRQCWTYYTFQMPPLFAVFAHGLAAVAFWRAGLLAKNLMDRIHAKPLVWMKRAADGE